MRRNTYFTTLLACAVLALGPACSDDDEHSDDSGHQHLDVGHSMDKEGCTHLQQGPYNDVTAGADSATAAEIKGDHHAYRVALTSGVAGFVKFAADAKGDHVLFLDADVALEVQDDKGAALTMEKSEKSVTECSEVKGKHTFELPAVGTYFFKLGPATADKVTLVIEEAGHSH